MGGEWYKETYAYKVFSAAMSAYIAKFIWTTGAHLDPEREFRDVMGCKIVGGLMALMAIMQAVVNVGVIGNMWEKKRR